MGRIVKGSRVAMVRFLKEILVFWGCEDLIVC